MSDGHPDATPEVVLYGKRDCPLCDEGREALRAVRNAVAFRLREVDIESDGELHRRYLERIPVVAVAEEVVCDLVVDTEAVVEAVRRAGAAHR